jgi:predicted ATPase
MRQGLAARQARGARLTLAQYFARLGEAYGRIGQPEEGLRLLAEALTLVASERWDEAKLYRIKGELLLRQAVPDAPQAEACFQQALAVARRQQGKRAQARELLAPIYSWFTEGFDTPDLQEAKALLEDLGR